MIASQYSDTQLRRLREMRNYITKNISLSDKDSAHELFYEKKWLHPLAMNMKHSSVKFTKFSCMNFYDRPFIQAWGNISVDLPGVFNTFFDKRWVTLREDHGFIRRDMELRFTRPIPMLLTYHTEVTMREFIRKLVVNSLSQRYKKDKINTAISKATKIKDLYDYNNEIYWKDNQTLRIEFNDYMKLMGKKVADNPLKATAAAYFVYSKTQNAKDQEATLNDFARKFGKEYLKYKAFGPEIYALSKLPKVKKEINAMKRRKGRRR